MLEEMVVEQYLCKLGHTIVARNISFKTGELDIVAKAGECLHVVEVKTRKCMEFPTLADKEVFSPAANLSQNKIRKLRTTAQWYVAHVRWEGGLQIDGALVWLRERDGLAKVRYFPQILT